VWKWFRLADQHNLATALTAVAARLVHVGKQSCRNTNALQGLSIAAMQALVVALASC
jgi:hypothetical protein